jgi:hypothetical protein
LRSCCASAVAAVSLLTISPAWAQQPSPLDIVKRAVAQDHSNAPRIRDFTYRMRQNERKYDSSGRVTSTTVKTWEISFLEGSPYRRLIARNDQPLSAEEQKFETDRMAYEAAQRRKESKADREKRVAEWETRLRKQREPVMEVPEAFDLKLAGEETVDGAPAWVIDAMPKQGYKPKSSSTAYLPKMKARFWIAKKDSQWLKMEAETLDTISFGAILVRLAKGSNLEMEQSRLEDSLCMPRRFVVHASARIALFKYYRTEIEYTLTDFRRTATDTVKTGAPEPR